MFGSTALGLRRRYDKLPCNDPINFRLLCQRTASYSVHEVVRASQLEPHRIIQSRR